MIMLQLFLEIEWIWINLGYELDWVVRWSTFLIVSLLPDGTVKEHQSLWWTTSHHMVGQWENWNPPTTLTRFDELNLRQSEQCFPRPSSYIQRMMKRTARRLIRLIAAIWGHFGTESLRFMSSQHGRSPPQKHWLIFLSRMFPFCPEKPTWTGSMPVIQACFVACFFSCQFLQTPFHFEEFFIFPFRGKVPCCQKSNCWRTFRSLPYGYICTSLRYWIQHDSSWKCWATHSTFICFYAR